MSAASLFGSLGAGLFDFFNIQHQNDLSLQRRDDEVARINEFIGSDLNFESVFGDSLVGNIGNLFSFGGSSLGSGPDRVIRNYSTSGVPIYEAGTADQDLQDLFNIGGPSSSDAFSSMLQELGGRDPVYGVDANRDGLTYDPSQFLSGLHMGS